MKKLFLSIAAAFALFTATAQRSYVSLYINMNAADSKWVSARVSGDIPASMKDYYAATYEVKGITFNDRIKITPNQKVLWEGAHYMNGAQTFGFADKIQQEIAAMYTAFKDKTLTVNAATAKIS